MIPAKTSITQIDSMPGEEIQFSIGDARWVMRTQADLYSNRELAVTREYSTNAFDANKERALRTGAAIAPIHVTLPSMMHPYFKVRDFGDGMSREVLAEVYTKFGESTKRDSNEFNGMLGYGCKSAVAYTDTFTVTSIHAGIKTIAVITRKPDWSIVMKIVSQSHSDEASGTEVQVPVHNWQEFATKANDFYKFWLPGTVLVNQKEPVHFVGEKITDGLYYANHTGWNAQSYVVMGNVPYRIENPSALFRTSSMRQINFVAYVDNGDVEFTPSREDLKYTEHTKRGLQKVIDDFEVKIVSTAKAEIDNATTHAEAYKAWSKWCDVLGQQMFGNLSFRGDALVQTFKVKGMKYNLNRYRNTTYTIDKAGVEEAPNTMFVTEFDVNMSSTNKAKAKEYANLKNWSVTGIIFTAQKDIDSVWIEKDKFVTWEALKAALPRKAAKPRQASGRLAGSYDYYMLDGYHDGKVVPTTAKDIYYIEAMVQRPKHGDPKNVVRLMNSAKMDKDAVVVRLGANRMEKFKRENPTVKSFMAHLKTLYVEDGPSLLSNEAKEVQSIDYRERQWLNMLDTSKLTDPDFAKYAKMIQNEDTLTKAYEDNLTLAKDLGMWYNVKKYQPSTKKMVTHKYSLLNRIGPVNDPDIYVYLNAAYAARKDKK